MLRVVIVLFISSVIGEILLPFISLQRLGRYKYCLYTMKTTGYFLCNKIYDHVGCVFCLLFSSASDSFAALGPDS